MGISYYAALPDLKPMADANPSLHPIAAISTPPSPGAASATPLDWTGYRVVVSAVVAPLRYQPVVASNVHEDANWKCEGKPQPAAGTAGVEDRTPWECLAVPWFNDPTALDRPVTDAGP